MNILEGPDFILFVMFAIPCWLLTFSELALKVPWNDDNFLAENNCFNLINNVRVCFEQLNFDVLLWNNTSKVTSSF